MPRRRKYRGSYDFAGGGDLRAARLQAERRFGVETRVLRKHGPGGGWPLVSVSGDASSFNRFHADWASQTGERPPLPRGERFSRVPMRNWTPAMHRTAAKLWSEGGEDNVQTGPIIVKAHSRRSKSGKLVRVKTFKRARRRGR